MAERYTWSNPVDLPFIVRADAYNAVKKRFKDPKEREVFMSGVDFCLKKYSKLINQTMNNWTTEEIQILKKAVSDSADDMGLAFEAASQMIGRTPTACSAYWYKHLRKEPDNYAMMCYAKHKPQHDADTEFPVFGVEAEEPSLLTKILNLFK